jgi:hypothetical protein
VVSRYKSAGSIFSDLLEQISWNDN